MYLSLGNFRFQIKMMIFSMTYCIMGIPCKKIVSDLFWQLRTHQQGWNKEKKSHSFAIKNVKWLSMFSGYGGNLCTWPNVTQLNSAPRCSIVALSDKAAEDPCRCRLTSCVRSLMLNNTERRGNQSCSEHGSGEARGRLHCRPFHYFERLTLDWLLKINRAIRV